MTGSNCALFGCSTSRTSELSLFKIPSVGKADGDETKAKKETARKEWLRVILRTRELTPDLKKIMDANNLFLCELHFKAEFIVDRKYRVISIAHDMLMI
jgi:hypothetical protein